MVPAMAGRSENRPITGRRKAKNSSTAIPSVDRVSARPMSFLIISWLSSAARKAPTGVRVTERPSARWVRPTSAAIASIRSLIRAATSVAVPDSAGLAMTRRWRPSPETNCPRVMRAPPAGTRCDSRFSTSPLRFSGSCAICSPRPMPSRPRRPDRISSIRRWIAPGSIRGPTSVCSCSAEKSTGRCPDRWSSSSGMSAPASSVPTRLKSPLSRSRVSTCRPQATRASRSGGSRAMSTTTWFCMGWCSRR